MEHSIYYGPTDEQSEQYMRPQGDTPDTPLAADVPPQQDDLPYTTEIWEILANDFCPSCHSTEVVDCADGEVCLACGWGGAQYEDHDGEPDSVTGTESSRA